MRLRLFRSLALFTRLAGGVFVRFSVGRQVKASGDSAISGRGHIASALRNCATSSDMFICAAAAAVTEAGSCKLFQHYLGSARLTQ